MQSRGVVISNKDKFKLNAEPSHETDILKAEDKFNLEAKWNKEVFFKPRFIPDVLSLTKPEVIMQSNEVIFKTGNESEQGAEPIQWKAENKIKSEGKLKKEVILKPQGIPDVLSLRKPMVTMQSNEVISKLDNIFKQKAEPSQETDILRAEDNTKLEARCKCGQMVATTCGTLAKKRYFFTIKNAAVQRPSSKHDYLLFDF